MDIAIKGIFVNEEKKKTIIYILIVVCVLLLIAGIVFVILMVGKNKKNQVNNPEGKVIRLDVPSEEHPKEPESIDKGKEEVMSDSEKTNKEKTNDKEKTSEKNSTKPVATSEKKSDEGKKEDVPLIIIEDPKNNSTPSSNPNTNPGNNTNNNTNDDKPIELPFVPYEEIKVDE